MMAAEDWDLFAVVRSCQSATNITIPSSFSTSTVKEELDYEAFSFPNITNEVQEINQLFTSFNPTTTSGHGINPNSPDFAGCINTPTSIWPHFLPQASNSSFNKFHDQQHNQLQVLQKQEFQLPQSSSDVVLPNQQHQTSKARKRKSQQGKMVCHVTTDNLSADLWAWRKYGQKPIKGSPYPRNYYRCSSSKGCTARKQVERSNIMAHMFTVTYTGDHNHPKPTHRNSLAGSTRNKSLAKHPPGPPPISLSFQTNTPTSSSSALNSSMTLSTDPSENNLPKERRGSDSFSDLDRKPTRKVKMTLTRKLTKNN